MMYLTDGCDKANVLEERQPMESHKGSGGLQSGRYEPITSTIMKVETREVKKEMTYFPIRILSEKNYSLTT